MIGIMLIGYYMWVYSVIRMHARMWYNWWQRTCDVRYIAPTTVETHVAPVNEDVISDSRDASMPSENSDFSTDTHQATVIEMKELLKHMPPKQIQSRSQETHVIEMETVQSIDQPSIAGKTNTDELEPSGHITTADTRSLELKDNQMPSCSTTIQNLIQPPLGNTQDIDTQTRADFSCIRSGNIAACVSTAVSANQEFSKEILGNIGDEDQLICVSESIFSRTTLQSLNVSSMVEIGDKQGCSSIGNTAASQSEGVEPRESQVTACSHTNSQHMIDVSSQASGSNIENK
ncbi:unnamed protein product [Acanthoscelides obtectus]|nr:unnamed protein product [Acanthoscelides obtectus]CAK1622188.1 hypothetical protein AOBTE_LOCUS1358 [Acanthoscelides obtectus]